MGTSAKAPKSNLWRVARLAEQREKPPTQTPERRKRLVQRQVIEHYFSSNMKGWGGLRPTQPARQGCRFSHSRRFLAGVPPLVLPQASGIASYKESTDTLPVEHFKKV